MKVPPGSGDEVIIEVFLCGRTPRILPFHDGHQLSRDLIQFISGKQVRHFSWWQDIVQVFQKSFILYLIVSENKSYASSLQAYVSHVTYIRNWCLNIIFIAILIVHFLQAYKHKLSLFCYNSQYLNNCTIMILEEEWVYNRSMVYNTLNFHNSNNAFLDYLKG